MCYHVASDEINQHNIFKLCQNVRFYNYIVSVQRKQYLKISIYAINLFIGINIKLKFILFISLQNIIDWS